MGCMGSCSGDALVRVKAATEVPGKAFLGSLWVSQRGLAFPQSCPEDTEISEKEYDG